MPLPHASMWWMYTNQHKLTQACATLVDHYACYVTHKGWGEMQGAEHRTQQCFATVAEGVAFDRLHSATTLPPPVDLQIALGLKMDRGLRTFAYCNETDCNIMVLRSRGFL